MSGEMHGAPHPLAGVELTSLRPRVHHAALRDAFVGNRRHNFSGTYVHCDVIGYEHQLFALGSV